MGLPELAEMFAGSRIPRYSFCISDVFQRTLFSAEACRHLTVCSKQVADVRVVLDVLVDKVQSLEIFSFLGTSPAPEIWRLFVNSQRNLKVFNLETCDACSSCRPDTPGPAGALVQAGLDSLCVPILAACLQNDSLTEISCRCASWSSIRKEDEALFQICRSASTRNISISVCGW